VHVDVGESASLVVDVPNHSGPDSVGYRPGMAVSCVCAPEAVRVLHRSPTASATGMPAGEAG
jgi:spermidine/putrescine transport system ATP-binding protein